MIEPPVLPPLRPQELEARMRPGAFSRGGYLGPGERLNEVLSRDRRTLRVLGLTCEELAGRLEALIRIASLSPLGKVRLEGRLDFGDELGRRTVEGRFETRIVTRRRYRVCPWALDPRRHHSCAPDKVYAYSDLDWTIRNLRTGDRMSGPGLAVHLVREHQFFHGERSPARMDPRRLALLLDLVGRDA